MKRFNKVIALKGDVGVKQPFLDGLKQCAAASSSAHGQDSFASQNRKDDIVKRLNLPHLPSLKIQHDVKKHFQETEPILFLLEPMQVNNGYHIA